MVGERHYQGGNRTKQTEVVFLQHTMNWGGSGSLFLSLNGASLFCDLKAGRWVRHPEGWDCGWRQESSSTVQFGESLGRPYKKSQKSTGNIMPEIVRNLEYTKCE